MARLARDYRDFYFDMMEVSQNGPSLENGWVDTLGAGLNLLDGVQPISAKRAFDLIFALLLLVLCGPLLAVAMLALWISSLGRDPVIYRQTRVGRGGRVFTLLKLRTMCMEAEPQGVRMATRNDPRITRIGLILRRSRIDELPQLINVLRGEMSLIGPRPERPEFVSQFAAELPGYSLRHQVKPGITGLAQVRCGYAEDLQDTALKLYYDLNYIRHGSLAMDVSVLLRTLPVVFFGWGAR